MMSKQTRTKLIREGRYLAEVTVELTESDDAWSPCLTVEDAYRLDDIRAALHNGDLEAAATIGKVYAITAIRV